MFSLVAILILGIVAFLLLFRKSRRAGADEHYNGISSRYLEGLNFLLNEQPDKAVDVFIEMIEVNSDTVETHLALGALFRRRGEVDRAIRIHQNLIARPNLSRGQRVLSLFELAQDYMRAGVLDRAEALFTELVSLGEKKAQSLHFLLDIYQRQREWEQAIQVANKIETTLLQPMSHIIAHYNCELAEEMLLQAYQDKAMRYLRKALHINLDCARAHLIQMRILCKQRKYKQVVQIGHTIAMKYPHFIIEMLAPLQESFSAMQQLHALHEFIQQYTDGAPELINHEMIHQYHVNLLATENQNETLIKKLSDKPTMHGVKLFADLKVQKMSGKSDVAHWQLISKMLGQLLAKQPSYQCSHCGFSSKSLYWFCPSCKHWDSIKLTTEYAQ